MNFRVSRVAALLFASGMCALIYQVAWFRELRLIFGASTSASAAVLAVFMGGLGLGGARLGKLADRSPNALALYANLELGVALMAAVTPGLVWLATTIYLAAGGSTTLGLPGATALRLALSVVVLGPATFLMGGTLPAAARAVEREGDAARRRVATLYGVNTMGAVLGTVLANFVLLEVLGTRSTLWAAALVNALVAIIGRSMSREKAAAEPAPAPAAQTDASEADEPPAAAELVRWFPPFASALAGVTFMLMELTWYRMLAPILGGSSYTFGLILAIALVGIGLGGGLYARTRVPATFRAFAITCGLEALFIAIPFALGDRIAVTTAILRPFSRLSFASGVTVWGLVASFVVLPAAVVSGVQFPLVIGLYGKGQRSVGRDVGMAYVANTAGAITGSLLGGFGLIPLLGAVGCWRLSVIALVVGAAVALHLDIRHGGGRRDASFARASVALLVAVLLVGARGPSGLWRHSGIGAGRADGQLEPIDIASLSAFSAYYQRDQAWEEDGVESSVALGQGHGYAFIVNGKSDGHSLSDAPTQVMSGLVPALLHPAPKTTLVVGLGTGSTAGWLGAIPSMERVDVVELEPAILRVAEACSPVNRDVLKNPKIHTQLADAREVLRSTPNHYDIVFSEPSNPYRAGISSMYTIEYYSAVKERLNPGGLFVQWLQAYEVDDWAVSTAMVTIRQVFAELEVWETESGDLLLLASPAPRPPVDVAKLRARLREEPFASAARSVWLTDSVEGVFAHLIANTKLSDELVARRLGAINTDDQNLLEFAFARSVGQRRRVDQDLRDLAARLGVDRPFTVGDYDRDAVVVEGWLFQALQRTRLLPVPESRRDLKMGQIVVDFASGRHREALLAWKKLRNTPAPPEGAPPSQLRWSPVHHGERVMVAEMAARIGGLEEAPLVELAPEGELPLLRGILLARGGDGAAAVRSLQDGFVHARGYPWIRGAILDAGLDLALEIGKKDKRFTRVLHDTLTKPFAVEAAHLERTTILVQLARAMGDAPLCVKALATLEPPPPELALLETRAVCYRTVGHPLAGRATEDLDAFLARTAAFGATIPTPSHLAAARSSAPSPASSGPRADAGGPDGE